MADYEVEIASEAEATPAEEPAKAAEAPAPAAVKADDLTQLAGVGAKSAEALNAAGLNIDAALADASEPAVRGALHALHIVARANVSTWPMQASFAAKGDWQGLAKYNQRRSGQARTTTAKSNAAPVATGSDV